MNVLDLCAGIGGFSLGCRWAGMTTQAFCEKDLECQRVLKKHWPNVPIFDDIYELNRDVLNEAGITNTGLVSAGYPCQPYSIAGGREGKNDDRDVWPQVFRIIQETNPTWVLGENVAGHIGLGLAGVLADLESAEFECQSFLIPALAVDAPHRRDRVFILAHANTEGLQGWQEIMDRERRRQGTFGTCDPLAISRRGWLPGSHLCGVDDGIPRRVDRIKMLGNSLVPQIVEVIARGIMSL